MKIFKIIYYVFFTFIGLIALVLVISIIPITGNIKFLVVKSGSMEPTIKTGSLVMVKPVSQYKVGDIINFGAWGKTKDPITHRIAEIKTNEGAVSYVTKGDANDSVDQREISANEIHGKVIMNLPYFGYAVDTAKKPLGFLIIIVVPALIIIIDEIRKIIYEAKKIRRQKEIASSENPPTKEN